MFYKKSLKERKYLCQDLKDMLECYKFFSIGGYKRAEYLKKIKYFESQGEHCFFQPWNFGSEPYLISFGNNVHIASNVLFVNHDVTAHMFSYQDGQKYGLRYGKINIGNNVFIGSGSIVLYDVHIGDNVVIGAGSLVNKDIPSGCVAAGVPCKVIGKYEDYKEKVIRMHE